jgi:hypothetical protein
MSSHLALAVIALVDVRFEAHCGLYSDIAPGPLSASYGLMHRSKKASSLDHFDGAEALQVMRIISGGNEPQVDARLSRCVGSSERAKLLTPH